MYKRQVLEQAAEDGSISTIVVAPEIDGDASKVTVELPKSSVSDIAGDSLDPVSYTHLGSSCRIFVRKERFCFFWH